MADARCGCGALLSTCFCAPFVADLVLGMEEVELRYRCRGRHNFRKIKIATISVRMVVLDPEVLQSGFGVNCFALVW